MDFIAKYASEIGSFVAGLAGGSLLTLKLMNSRAGRDITSVNQSRATAGGDVVGGDKHTSGNSR